MVGLRPLQTRPPKAHEGIRPLNLPSNTENTKIPKAFLKRTERAEATWLSEVFLDPDRNDLPVISMICVGLCELRFLPCYLPLGTLVSFILCALFCSNLMRLPRKSHERCTTSYKAQESQTAQDKLRVVGHPSRCGKTTQTFTNIKIPRRIPYLHGEAFESTLRKAGLIKSLVAEPTKPKDTYQTEPIPT